MGKKMNHYTDKDMTSEEFCNLLKDRLERNLPIEGYSYSSSNGTKVRIRNSKKDYSWIGILLMIISLIMLSFL